MADSEFGLLVVFCKYIGKELCVFIVASLYVAFHANLAGELRGCEEQNICVVFNLRAETANKAGQNSSVLRQ